MGSKAALEDIQRLLSKLHRQIGSDAPGKGRQVKGRGKGVKAGENWDCPHCADGIDNFASRTRCFKCGGNRDKNGEPKQVSPKQGPGRAAAPRSPATGPRASLPVRRWNPWR